MRNRGVIVVTLALGLVIGASKAMGVAVVLDSTHGTAGSTVAAEATLRAMGAEVKGISAEFTVDSKTPLSACLLNPIFNAVGTIQLHPEGCQAGVDCLSARAILAELSSATIADGTVLYSCDFKIAGDAQGLYPIACVEASASDPGGIELPTTCSNGCVAVDPTACIGDCNFDGEVFGNEVTVAINIVAGSAGLSACRNIDADCDGEVFGNEVTIAINKLASGCLP